MPNKNEIPEPKRGSKYIFCPGHGCNYKTVKRMKRYRRHWRHRHAC